MVNGATKNMYCSMSTDFPKINISCWVPLVKPKSRYYMVIFPKSTSVAEVSMVQLNNRHNMVVFL